VKILLKRNKFRHEGDKVKYDDTAVAFSKESVSKLLWTMEVLLEKVCGV
jgi:hypothetical protein